MIKIPEHLDKLVAYKPGKPIQELRREYGLDSVAKLGSNENSFGPSPKAIEAMNNAMKELMWYPEPAAIDLRTKLANKLGVEFDQISLGSGSEGILNYLFKAFTNPGDTVLTSEGTFIGVYVLCQSHNVNCKKINLTEDYAFNLEKIVDEIDKNTKIVYLANPNNPTGTYFSKSEFENFIKKVPNNILVILDEAYFEFGSALFEDYPNGLDYLQENIIVLRTFSKAYGLAGARIGYGISSKRIAELLMKIKLPFEPSLLAQAAGSGAIEDDEFLYKTIENAKIGMKYIHSELEKMSLHVVKSAANFITIVFESEEKVNKISAELLKVGVITRPLIAFGLANCLRITIGTEEENERFILELKKLL
jgi:histidinol-phosphate aminotransferase